MSPSACSGRGSASGDQSTVKEIYAMTEEPNEISYTEKKPLEEFIAASSEHFVLWIDKVSVSSIIELVEKKFLDRL